MTEPSPIREEPTFDVGRALRWLAAVAVVLLVLGLVAYARGEEHKRGDDVGALPAAAVVR